ncbi:hypothetical protein [Clostridium paraputrificum]|uniref:hypothetical protein n=1 Tax=Clostridium paraputrificum TaxID=29363 RepID=UPI00189A6659|nr:hypothetical protein [Clostridium paraputrificum]
MFKRIYLSDKQCEYLAKGIALGIAIGTILGAIIGYIKLLFALGGVLVIIISLIYSTIKK